MKKEAIRVVTTVPVAPTTLYFAWLDSEQHTAMTGSAAKLSNDVGQKYSALNGWVTGKLITLDLGRRMVISWRTTDFPRDAADSRVEIHLEALGGSTRVTVIHTELPEGHGDPARNAWNDKYFTPMRNHFSKYLPDPRNPPPPRRPPPPPEEEEEEVATTPKGAKGKPGKAPPPPPAKGKGPSVAKVEAKSGKKLTPPPAKKAPPPPAPAKAAKPAKKAAAPAKPAKKAPAPAKKAPAKPAKKPAAKKPAAKPAKKKK